MARIKKRSPVRVTKWYLKAIEPRITKRDLEILRFIHKHKIVTRRQIQRVFFSKSKYPTACNRRLRILYELHCIKRFFPLVGYGSAQQHVTLDKAGAALIGVDNYYDITTLPQTYQHTVAITELYIELSERYRVEKWVTEPQLKRIRPDVYAVINGREYLFEIDMGTEVQRTIAGKLKSYKDIKGLPKLIFVTYDGKERKEWLTNLVQEYGVRAQVWMREYQQ